MTLDWTAFIIGAIPSVLALITFLLQLRRDKQKDVAVAGRTRAEGARELATGEKTRIEATEKIIGMYEGIIERLEARILELESELENYKSVPPRGPVVDEILEE